MPRARRKLLYILGGLLAAVLCLGGAWGWQVLRVEELPDELPAMERSPDEVVLSSVGHGPDLPLRDLRGQRSVIVFEGVQSMRSEQGKEVNRALNRWILPDDTKGYIVWDGEGMRVFEDRATQFVGFFAEELRFPIYVDWDGQMGDVFKLVKGHHGLIVLGEDGQVLLRKSGGLRGTELDELRALVGASEPPEPPPAPKFQLGDVDDAACRQRPCLFVFLGKPVARTDIPWIEDGFEGGRTECFERMRRPEIRLAASAMRVPITRSHGVLVGETEGLDLKGWTTLSDDADAREAFGLGPEDSALIVVDAQGRLAFRETGFIPMYRWTLAIDVTGETILRNDEG
ncbi:hypothetical protein [Paraliomyxa miuraensis]|uniref:hypothetical protein n=1 Tax=Paraliomyxa miuraensis TaxID=376150 RepID=UPI00224E629D|nr:hypothetical protein [Paraliomyxa miuraensis]MCX4245282.1 hypothetical protein [Paraliomyxa miuraensis]